VGSHLAKRQVMVSMQEWLKRIPAFELSPDQSGQTVFGGSVMGFSGMKLRW
jgi:cytochrome P450